MATKLQCRRCPASVHSTNATWQTSFGVTQRHCSIFSAVSDSPHREAFFSGRFVNGQCAAVSFLRAGKMSWECSTRQRKFWKRLSPKKNRNEVLGARVNLYMVAKKWEMAAAVASHLVKVDPQTASWWISLAYSVRRTEGVENAEAILLRAQAIHPKVAMIVFNLACYASVTGRMEEAKERLQHAIKLDRDIRGLALDDEDLKPLWDWIVGLE